MQADSADTPNIEGLPALGPHFAFTAFRVYLGSVGISERVEIVDFRQR
jgi:hypothetical protein